MAEPLAIDVAAAQAALDAAGGMPDTFTPPGQERDANGQFVASTPDPTPPAVPIPAAAPEAVTPPPAAPAAPEADADFGSFSNIDVSALTPEQAQMHRSLQADYTRKMQEAAPWRKLGQELGIDSPDEFKTAAEVYQRIQDPRNWPTIHSELTQYMQQYGMSPAQASQAASDQLMEFAPDTQQQQVPAFNPDEVDPGLAPLLQAVASLQNQVKTLTDQTTQERQQAQQTAQWNAIAQRLTNEESQIRQLNPSYTDAELTDIYSLMGPEGNLLAAQQRYESMIGAKLSQYIAGKGAALTGAVPLPGGQVIATPVADQPLSVDAGHAAAMAHVAALDRADATS
jgi:hypothetical protein